MATGDGWAPASEHSEDRTVTVRGARLRVRERGQGRPLLLIMGLGGNIEMWEPFESAIGDRRVIMYDAPGTGRSPRTRATQRMEWFAGLVADLLAELEIEQADVLGISLGGAVAQELARHHPARVRRLVLAATTCGMGGVPPSPGVMLLMATPLRYWWPWYLERTAPRIYGGRSARAGGPPRQQVRARRGNPPGPVGYLWQMLSVMGWTSLAWLHEIRHPTLVLGGDDDRLVPFDNSRMLADRIPDARLHRVPGGGHLFLVEEPEEVIGPILSFLDGGRSSPAPGGVRP